MQTNCSWVPDPKAAGVMSESAGTSDIRFQLCQNQIALIAGSSTYHKEIS